MGASGCVRVRVCVCAGARGCGCMYCSLRLFFCQYSYQYFIVALDVSYTHCKVLMTRPFLYESLHTLFSKQHFGWLLRYWTTCITLYYLFWWTGCLSRVDPCRNRGICSSLPASVTATSTWSCLTKNCMEHLQIMASASRCLHLFWHFKKVFGSHTHVLLFSSPQSVAQHETWSCSVPKTNRPEPAGSRRCACWRSVLLLVDTE